MKTSSSTHITADSIGKKLLVFPSFSCSLRSVFISGAPQNAKNNQETEKPSPIIVSHRAAPHSAIRRLLLMSYFPSGFWSRLLTRMLADESLVDIINNYFVIPQELLGDEELSSVLGGQAEWTCWQTGMELHHSHTTLFRLREVIPQTQEKEPQTSPVSKIENIN